jgi:hypothetical protein
MIHNTYLQYFLKQSSKSLLLVFSIFAGLDGRICFSRRISDISFPAYLKLRPKDAIWAKVHSSVAFYPLLGEGERGTSESATSPCVEKLFFPLFKEQNFIFLNISQRF